MTVWMCSGQGAQKVNMGADLLDIPEVKQVFERGSYVLDVDLIRLAKEGCEEEINDPFKAQALTMALSVGIGKALLAQKPAPNYIVGFSLGQISALALAEVLSLEDAFSLLRVRASAMAAACRAQAGAMLALLGATHEEAAALCEACAGGEVLLPANYNCPGQVVISGTVEAIDRAEAAWREAKKKCARLNTAGAFHSPLMKPAGAALADFLISEDAPQFSEGSAVIICNTDAKPFEIEEAKQRLVAQVSSPVCFEQSIEALIENDEIEFVEIGYGGVLFNLVKRINKDVQRYKVGTREELDEYIVRR